MAEAKDIQQLAKVLNLQNIASGEIDLNDEKLSNKDFLYNILLQEVNIRNANKAKDLKKQAKLPDKAFDKTRITEGTQVAARQAERIRFLAKQTEHIHSR